MDRLVDPRMEYYKDTYSQSVMWDGQASLIDKTVIVYAEQGFGDIIQFSRYIPRLKSLCGKLFYHCPKELHRLFACLGVELLDKNNPDLPPHDFHVLSLELPFVLAPEEAKSPYLMVYESEWLPDFKDKTKIGIVWESGTLSDNAPARNCPMEHFKLLQKENTVLFSLQKEIRDPSLICEDMVVYGAQLEDFYDTAKLINAMDFVASVDTAVLHLAGALGKTTYGLFNKEHDPRWDLGNWYPIVAIKAKEDNDWAKVLKTVKAMSGI